MPLAVDGPANIAKGDKDAGAWLPPNSAYHCKYVAKQISIKTKYELWVTQPEQTEMADVIADCRRPRTGDRECSPCVDDGGMDARVLGPPGALLV